MIRKANRNALKGGFQNAGLRAKACSEATARFIRSPHWDLKHRRVGMKHPTFSEVKGKSWNAIYLRYLPDDKFEELSEAAFFEPIY